jgi:hypothetical protein
MGQGIARAEEEAMSFSIKAFLLTGGFMLPGALALMLIAPELFFWQNVLIMSLLFVGGELNGILNNG